MRVASLTLRLSGFKSAYLDAEEVLDVVIAQKLFIKEIICICATENKVLAVY